MFDNIVVPDQLKPELEVDTKPEPRAHAADGNKASEDVKIIIKDNLNKMATALVDSLNKQNSILNGNSNKLNEIDAALKSFSKLIALERELEEKQKLIRTYQEGYNWSLLKNYILPILRTIDNIERNIRREDSEHVKDILLGIRDELLFSMNALNIEMIKAQPGDVFDPAIHKIIETNLTDDEFKNNTICKISKMGFKYYLNEGNEKILREVEVIVYKYNNKKEI